MVSNWRQRLRGITASRAWSTTPLLSSRTFGDGSKANVVTRPVSFRNCAPRPVPAQRSATWLSRGSTCRRRARSNGLRTLHSSKVSRRSTSMVESATPSGSRSAKGGSGGPGRPRGARGSNATWLPSASSVTLGGSSGSTHDTMMDSIVRRSASKSSTMSLSHLAAPWRKNSAVPWKMTQSWRSWLWSSAFTRRRLIRKSNCRFSERHSGRAAASTPWMWTCAEASEAPVDMCDMAHVVEPPSWPPARNSSSSAEKFPRTKSNCMRILSRER
mmetsp:Transcript_41777/g.108190  ORF Transcript_41777/g.108190 Transcript_41777/m.108190 type:complete len:272 (+) Transcript_41777:311-1126(+)